jgi:hypothetical protein
LRDWQMGRGNNTAKIEKRRERGEKGEGRGKREE